MMKILFFTFLLSIATLYVGAQNPAEAILGKWMSEENNCEVDILKNGNEFYAIIIWFDDTDDPSRPMNERRDIKNPDKSLRNHKIIGSRVLQGLVYNNKKKGWEDGFVYDATSGRTWNANVWLMDNGNLKVRGFWHFQWLGRNLFFKRVDK